MPHPQFDRRRLKLYPLDSRENRVHFERDQARPEDEPEALSAPARDLVLETAHRIRQARDANAPRMLAFGAHAIKNGLAPIFARLIEREWITHLATNGAGIIHDWEFAFMGETSEHVRENVAGGRFGLWEETGRWLNLALNVGALDGLGYGESVGRLVEDERLAIPRVEALENRIRESAATDPEDAAAAADLLALIKRHQIETGVLSVPHPHKKAGLQAAAYRLGVPYTGHPMFGHDIHYMHPLNQGAAVGRTAERDFLTFADAVSRIENGVYISLGSAVMSPMVFEKSFAMAQNLALQHDAPITNHFLLVVDLNKSRWDWTRGEPPEDNPDYYLRYNKTFSRMGGTMRYLSADNRDFSLALLHALEE